MLQKTKIWPHKQELERPKKKGTKRYKITNNKLTLMNSKAPQLKGLIQLHKSNKLTVMNPKAPQLKGLIKLHKPNKPIRSLTNNVNARTIQINQQ